MAARNRFPVKLVGKVSWYGPESELDSPVTRPSVVGGVTVETVTKFDDEGEQ